MSSHPRSSRASTVKAAYRNASLPPEKRVRDLLARMTLAEKAAQMLCIWRGKADTLVDASGRFDHEKARAAFRARPAPGQIGRPSDAGPRLGARAMAELTNTIQRFFLQETRLGIPVVFHEECLHGLAAREATSFPQPIALAGTFNPALVEAIFTATALEARSRGAHQALTPVADVALDPRWGRVEETYGEDPFLVACMSMAAVRGFQGDRSFQEKTRLIATLKHFAAHGLPESGMNCAPANIGMRMLREAILLPFQKAIQQAGAISVMASYNEIDGLPSHANRWLLRDVLREEWGFTGYVVSDYFAVRELAWREETHGHFLARDGRQACELAVKAGVNIELPDPDCYLHIPELVRKGRLRERQLDELLAPMLLWKFKLGLFDDPYVDPDKADEISGCTAHLELALQAARESITLLRNHEGLLPLKLDEIRTIAVIGPNAHRSLLGGYSGIPRTEVTVLEGIRERVGRKARVLYEEGCRITVGGSWEQDEVVPADPEENRRMIASAVRAARKADVIILAIGGNEQTSREAWSRAHMGDRATLDLIGQQGELARALLATGKPVVVLLFGGSPFSISWLSQAAPAILQCWYLGQECGRAVAEVLFGDYSPSGKLPISFPRSVGHLPCYYWHKPSARRGYLFEDCSPLYPFGYGLSYANFSLDKVRLHRQRISIHDSTRLTAEVTNQGPCAGSETIQLYIRDRFSSVTRPVKQLKGFAKVFLEPGESTSVCFEITPDLLAFYDIDMNFRVEPGEFDLLVGTSSRDEDLRKLTLTVR